MKRKTVSVWVGGAAGDGIASVGESLAKIFARNGLHVYAYNSYQSVIRGGHVWWQMRAGSEKVYTQPENCHLLIALNQDFRLAREWFVITHSNSLSSALVAFDEVGSDRMPEQIRYWALKTSNTRFVGELANAVEGVIDWSLAA